MYLFVSQLIYLLILKLSFIDLLFLLPCEDLMYHFLYYMFTNFLKITADIRLHVLQKLSFEIYVEYTNITVNY